MRVVVALGGNALSSSSVVDLRQKLGQVSSLIVTLLKCGHKVAIVHGSGPQAGALLLQNEQPHKKFPLMPLDVIDAEVQGQLGYLIGQLLSNDLKKHNLNIPVVTLITQVVVDQNDPAFKDPTKPVGSFYKISEVKKLKKKGQVFKEDAGRGYRRVVPSPKPKSIVEIKTIKKLFSSSLVIAAGGGGIPVIEKKGKLAGVEAVIDKDFAASLLAVQLNAELLLIVTSIDRAYLNFGKKSQRAISEMHLNDAELYLDEGHFAEGSMAPKIRASIDFLKSGGRKAIITNISNASGCIEQKKGTVITR